MTIRDHMISKKNAEARLVDQAKADGGPGSGPHKGLIGKTHEEMASDLARTASLHAAISNTKNSHSLADEAHTLAAHMQRAAGNQRLGDIHAGHAYEHSLKASGL